MPDPSGRRPSARRRGPDAKTALPGPQLRLLRCSLPRGLGLLPIAALRLDLRRPRSSGLGALAFALLLRRPALLPPDLGERRRVLHVGDCSCDPGRVRQLRGLLP
eukprot:15261158-Alexandrium_andersonii.AAC.1